MDRNHSIWSGVGAFFALLIISFLFLMLVGVWLNKKEEIGSEKIALIKIENVISDSTPILEQLDKYSKNKTVKAIVLRLDTPGGAVGPSQEIYQAVREIRQAGKQKVVVSMGAVAASGGYYIACAADKIVANPGTITGSIGVIMEFGNVEELFKKIGLKATVVKTGPHKDIGSPVRDMTPEEKVIVQELLDDVYNQFIDAIADGRNMEVDKIKEIADGRIFSGARAKQLGLVDELGNLPYTLELTAKLAGIKDRPLEIIQEEEEHPLSRLLRAASNTSANLLPPWKNTGLSLQYR